MKIFAKRWLPKAVRKALAGTMAGAALALLWCGAWAAGFPDRPVRMIVAFPPGGGTDIVARIIAPRLTAKWGQQVIVDNRAGAGGVIGTEAAARSPADGYTIFMGTFGNFSVNPHMYPMTIDPSKDFAPVSEVVAVNFVLVVNPNLPVHNVRELIALAKQKPGQINYSSSGVGGAPQLAGELFDHMTGVKLTHIPYKGSAPSFADLLSGQVSLTFDSLVQALPYIQAGKLRALAVLGSKRSPLLPDVPTMAEAGVPGYSFTNWFGIAAPAGTPPDRVRALHDAVAAVQKEPAIREQLEKMGADVTLTTPQEFGKLIRDDSAKWAAIIKEADIKP
jgi:tripartite-type tricarboxylate transporter receptor subunit TctC